MASIDTLIARQKKLEARIRAEKAKERQKQQRDIKRREQLLGRLILAHITEQPEDVQSRWVKSLLAETLEKPVDRALFDLEAARVPEAKPALSTLLGERVGAETT